LGSYPDGQFVFQEGREAVKKKAFVPPPRFFNIDEARWHFSP
jgi:hypothetical protein